MEILELKITISEIKNSIDEVNSHCITADERINEVKEILIENNYSKERTKQKTLERERKRQRDRASTRWVWRKNHNICVIVTHKEK